MSNLRLDRISVATSAQRGTIPLRVLLTTNATAHAAISLSSTKSLSSSDRGPANKTNYTQLEYGPMPNVMVALPNIGGALCSTPQSLADAHY